jgi:RNA polymerase sigma factor (sigma-70 family)
MTTADDRLTLTAAQWERVVAFDPLVRPIAAKHGGRDLDEIEAAVRRGLIVVAVRWERVADRHPDFGPYAVAWMHREARWAELNRRRRWSRHEAQDAALGLPSPPDRRGEFAESAEEAEVLLAGLPDDRRAAARLVWLHGLTQAEAAAELGVPEGRVRGWLFAARAVVAATARARIARWDAG